MSLTTFPNKTDRCTPDQWSCLNGQCIPQSAHCNQVQDCPQGEDELLCDGVEPQPDDGKLLLLLL
jgi:hypothetical protein